MPIIRPSSDLRNNYNEISTICHQADKYTLYKELEKGINSLKKEKKYSSEEVYEKLKNI